MCTVLKCQCVTMVCPGESLHQRFVMTIPLSLILNLMHQLCNNEECSVFSFWILYHNCMKLLWCWDSLSFELCTLEIKRCYLGKQFQVKKSLANFMDTCYIQKEPFGVAMVIGAWNYPIQLTIMPIVGAIAAGTNFNTI